MTPHFLARGSKPAARSVLSEQKPRVQISDRCIAKMTFVYSKDFIICQDLAKKKPDPVSWVGGSQSCSRGRSTRNARAGSAADRLTLLQLRFCGTVCPTGATSKQVGLRRTIGPANHNTWIQNFTRWTGGPAGPATLRQGCVRRSVGCTDVHSPSAPPSCNGRSRRITHVGDT